MCEQKNFLTKLQNLLITDTTCQLLILQNKDFYIDLINTSKDDAYELKNSLNNIIKQDSNTQLVEFVAAITMNDSNNNSE